MTAADGVVVVWGNCQTEPIAQFLTAPLARHGLRVVPVPPVYLVTAEELHAVRQLVARCAVLITQPVRSHYRMPGDGAADLMALAPADARIITIPAAYDSTEFPYQYVGHLADGQGIFAPLTSYHDLRLVRAAEQGWGVGRTLTWWPGPASADAVCAVAHTSQAEMRRREASLDVRISDRLGRLGSMFTVNHASNGVLVTIANRVLDALGIGELIEVPGHEELDHTRTPLEPHVLEAHGWPIAHRSGWHVGGQPVRHEDVVASHLALYADWPEVVVEARRRHGAQMEMLGL